MLHKPDLETPALISNKDQRLLLNTFLLNMNGIIIASDNFFFPRLISSLCDQASPCSGDGIIVVVGRAFGDLHYGHCILHAREHI